MPPQINESVFALQGLRRHRRGLIAGTDKVKAGQRFRTGAQTAYLSLNTFFSKFHCNRKGHMYKNTALDWGEEVQIVKMLLKGYHQQGYIKHEAIKDATTDFVAELPAARRERVRFRDSRPSKSFCKAFEKRHCYAIYCEKPFNEEGDEAPLITAKELVRNFLDLTDMIEKEKLHPDKVFCLTCKNVPVKIGQGSSFIKFLSVLTVSNAAGQVSSFKYITHNGSVTEAIQDSDDFQGWLSQVWLKIHGIGFHQQDNQHPYHLLLCDNSLEFITSAVREYLFLQQIIVYSIPGLGDGFPGNHDVGCAGLWAKKFQEIVELELEMKAPCKVHWTEGTLLTFIHHARNALSPRNISDSFADAGIFPMDEVRFYKHPRPLSFEEPGTMCDLETMCQLLDNGVGAICRYLMIFPEGDWYSSLHETLHSFRNPSLMFSDILPSPSKRYRQPLFCCR